MAKKTFESALKRLEKITEELESGELSLENSLKKFDEGVQLADFCNTQLSEAKAKVEILIQKNGQLKPEPYQGINSGDQDLSE